MNTYFDLSDAYFDIIAVRDLMAFIDQYYDDDKIDKDTLRVFSNSLDRALKIIRKCMDNKT